MTRNNVRIAIRDSTDSYIVGFFDNVSGINYHTADLQRFLAGSSSILTLKYRTKDIDKVTAGCKLAFRYKDKDFWLSIMEVKKNGFDKELTAFSLILEANNEDKGPFSADKGMTMAEYIKKFDAESSLTIGINEVADKSIKLEWTGTDTMLARLFSVANSFGAELEFVTELNNDYSLKRHVLNIYRTGNFGKNATGLPIRVGKELKVINYSENIKNLRTVVFATGKDGLTIEGLSKKVYDDNGELLYETSGAFIRAVQSRDRFPSVGKNTTDNYALLNLGDTEYETKEALYGYMLSELKKRCLPEMDFEVEGVIDGDVGDTKTLIDDVFHEPELYVQARISELTESMITGENTNVVLSNYERKYSQIADSLLKQVEALAEDAAPYIVRLSTDNGYNFKNGQGTSTITAKLEKYSKIVNSNWKWLINNSIVSETSSVTINASQVVGTLNVVAVAIVDGNEVAREYITFTNSDDGVGIKSITRYYTTNDQAEGVTAGGQNWSTKPTTVTADNNYMWSYDVITYTNDTSLVTEPAVIGARGDDGLDADTTGITEALDKAKQELTALSANIEKVRDDSLAASEEAKQQLTAVANDLSAAKQDLQTQASQLQAQASAQSELTKRVSSVEETANGTKTTVSELSKTVDSNTKDITSVTARTKTVEDDLLNTKTTLSQVKTTADNTSQKTATLETGLTGLTAKFENLQIGTVNLLHNSKGPFKPNANKVDNWQRFEDTYVYLENGKQYVLSGETDGNFTSIHDVLKESDNVVLWLVNPDTSFNKIMSDDKTGTTGTVFTWNSASGTYQLRVNTYRTVSTKSAWNIQIEEGNLRSTYSQNEADIESKVAEYKQTADQNYASLQSNLQTLDGTVKQNKSEFDQTASQLKTSISAVEGKASELDGDITKLNTTLTQTANGLEQLSTQVTSQGNTITSHTNSINSLTTGLSAKVSQTDFNTLNSRVTTAENNITAKANELSSKISSVEGLIPTSIDTVNLIKCTGSAFVMGFGITNTTWNETKKQSILDFSVPGVNRNIKPEILPQNGKFFDFKPIKGTTYTQSIMIDTDATFEQNGQAMCSWFTINGHNQQKAYIKKVGEYSYQVWSTYTWNLENTELRAFDWYDLHNILLFRTTGTYLAFYKPKLTTGNLPSDWSPSPEDYDSALATAQSEIKQTTDAISASVSALDNATVKTASLNLDNNGFVTKVGKTVNGNTFATMIAQNESDVQIIAEKMKVSGDMIVNGAITGEKIQANSIDVSKISGLDATYLKAKIETAMVDWLKGKTIVADNGATKIDLLSGYINFDSDTPAIRRVTTGIPTQFLKFLRDGSNSVTTIGSNRDGSESSMNDSFAGIKITSGDSLEQTEIISDQIYFFTGAANRQGWQMSTVSGEDNRQITLFPSGNPTKSNIYASDYFIKGSNGWVKLIDFINYFNTCMKHLQNHTGRTDIWNAFQL